MANLYEIDREILDTFDDETGEILDDGMLNELIIKRENKIEQLALYRKNLLANADAYEAEEKVFYERKRHAMAKAESIKNYLNNYLDGEKFETTRVKISFRKSESVEILNEELIGEDYLSYKEPTINKEKIKQDIKNGIDVSGAKLIQNRNIQIK